MAIFKPEVYHGFKKQSNFFEGWYYKLATKDKRRTIALIPGVSIGDSMNSSHSFIQFIDSNNKTEYVRFSIDDFKADKDKFKVTIDGNLFDGDHVNIHIDNPSLSLKGEVNFENKHPWPVSVFSPGAMGWYSYIPFMECYHGVISMDHDLEGQIELNSELIDFDGGKGYIEKDWGKSFPSAWIWLQSNHFELDKSSIMVSVATIPWMGRNFTGFIVGLLNAGKLYRFATYNGSKLRELQILDDRVLLVFDRRNYTLKVEAFRTDGGELKSPVMGNMEGRINETLSARVNVSLTYKSEMLFCGTGTNAGLEVVGNLVL
ncbi:MAG: tocopherol cyclase family protein [Kosmotogaceae bacterium]